MAVPPGVPGSPANDEERETWTGPKAAAVAPDGEEDESEIDEADGDII